MDQKDRKRSSFYLLGEQEDDDDDDIELLGYGDDDDCLVRRATSSRKSRPPPKKVKKARNGESQFAFHLMRSNDTLYRCKICGTICDDDSWRDHTTECNWDAPEVKDVEEEEEEDEMGELDEDEDEAAREYALALKKLAEEGNGLFEEAAAAADDDDSLEENKEKPGNKLPSPPPPAPPFSALPCASIKRTPVEDPLFPRGEGGVGGGGQGQGTTSCPVPSKQVYGRKSFFAEPPSSQRVRRPLNAFMVWAKIRRAEMRATHSGTQQSGSTSSGQSEISVLLGEDFLSFLPLI